MKFPRHWLRRQSAQPDNSTHPPPRTSPTPTNSSPSESSTAINGQVPPRYSGLTRKSSIVAPPHTGVRATDDDNLMIVAEETGPDGTRIVVEPTTERDRVNVVILLREDYVTIRQWLKTANWKDMVRVLLQKSMIKWYIILSVAIVLSVLITVKHDDVVHFCHPIAKTIRSWPAGFMIPIVLLIIVSYPPLVGHEILGILIGLVWDLGQGFAILAAGTFIGELLLWISFKWCCHARAAKFEKKNKLYSSLTTLIREKTFMFVLILRFSAVPGHIVTAVSASAGANIWSYIMAAFLTLPKQFAIVYLGAAFGTKDRTHTTVSTVVMVLTVLGTVVAAMYVYYQMRLVMRRKNFVPIAVVPMSETGAPSWADVANAELGGNSGGGPNQGFQGGFSVRRHSTGGHVYFMTSPPLGDEKYLGGGGGGTTPGSATGDDKFDLGVDREDIVPALTKSKPWNLRDDDELAAQRGNARAWSVPHHMTPQEMKEFATEIGSPKVAPISPTSPGFTGGAPLSWRTSFTEETKPLKHGRSPSVSPNPSNSNNPLAVTTLPIGEGIDELSPLDRYPPPASPTRPQRGAASLDFPRSGVAPSGSGSGNGRQIADEADLYAYQRGGSRPDFSRFRGESRAALLGRPKEFGEDDADSTKGSLKDNSF